MTEGPVREPGSNAYVSPSERAPWATRDWMHESVIGALVGLLCVAVAVVVYRLNPADLDVLLGAGGDLTPLTGFLKGTLEGGDLTRNPNLGYPGFQDIMQVPILTDTYHWAHLVPLARVFGDAVTAINSYIIVGFFQIGLSAYLLLRLLGVYRFGAIVLAAALALLPWHFARAVGHLFLASYAPAIVGVGLVVAVWRGYFDRGRPLRLVGGLALVLLAGLGGIYYAFMTSLLMAVVLVRRLLSWRARPIRWPSVVIAVAVPAVMGVTVVLNSAAQHTYGTGWHRTAHDSTLYGGTVASLFLPDTRSMFATALTKLRPEFNRLLVYDEGTAAFNVVIIAALFLVVVVLVVALFRPAAAGGWLSSWLRAQRRIGYLQGLLLVVLIMFASVGGGVLFAYLVTPEIRAWVASRCSSLSSRPRPRASSPPSCCGGGVGSATDLPL